MSDDGGDIADSYLTLLHPQSEQREVVALQLMLDDWLFQLIRDNPEELGDRSHPDHMGGVIIGAALLIPDLEGVWAVLVKAYRRNNFSFMFAVLEYW